MQEIPYLHPFQPQRLTGMGVSAVCAVRDRTQMLDSFIGSILGTVGVANLILVDYGSSDPVVDCLTSRDLVSTEVAAWPDARVLVVRVEDDTPWHLAKALNLGMQFVPTSFALKIDVDVMVVEQDLFRRHSLSTGNWFYAGDWRGTERSNRLHLNGTCYLATKDFWRVGGYDERFECYGFEDEEFYGRLQDAGLRRLVFERNSLYHLPHPTKLRLINFDTKFTTPEQSAAFNECLLADKLKWNGDEMLTRYVVTSKQKRPIPTCTVCDLSKL